MAFGKTFYGAQRWLDLGFFRYQPSETMKLTVVLVLAKVLSQPQPHQGLGFRGLAWPLVITLLPFVLTVRQPDLGTALLIAAISGSMILFVGVRKSILVLATVSCVVAAPLVWSFGLKPYQKSRILTFLTPGKDPRGAGYNSIQSKIAVGSGKVLEKVFEKAPSRSLSFYQNDIQILFLVF